MADAKERDEKAFQGVLSQSETQYTPLSGTPGKACANCRWFFASNHCFIVGDNPEPILATGLCSRHEPTPAPIAPDMPAPIPVVIIEPEEMMEMALPADRKSLLQMITDTVKGLLQPSFVTDASFTVFKASGKFYWLARHTGKFMDREGEIIADQAHVEYVERVQKGLVPMPELWTWHTKGTRHGQADMVWKAGGFVLALGHFDDTPEAQHAIQFYEKQAGNIKLSHMFTFPQSAKQDGVYYAYNTIEITTLPAGAEAFPYTNFEEFKPMALTKEQREFIKGVGGDDMLARVEAADAKAEGDTKTHDANGITSKGMDNFEGASIPVPQSEVEALKSVQADFENRIKAVEVLPDQIKTLHDTVKLLGEQVAAEMDAKNAALEKVNALEAQLLEYKALQPPASQSKDTLLNEREQSLIERVTSEAKSVDRISLVEKMVGGQPTVATGESE